MTTPLGEQPRPTEPPESAAATRDAAGQLRPRRGPSMRTFEAFRNEHFRLFYSGNLLQFAAMQMQMLVRGQLVFMLTGSFAKLGIIALANAIPGLLMAPVGGVVADRATKKTVIQIGQTYNLINAAILAVLAAAGLLRFEHLFISAVLQGSVNSVMQPSRQSMIPDLVGREGLMNAVALNTSGQNLMQIVGPAMGATLLSVISPAAVFAAISAAYLLAVTFTVRLPKEPLYSYGAQVARAGGVRGPRARGSFKDLFMGLGYVARDPRIRTLIAVNFLIVLVSMPYQQLLPGFVKTVLGRGAGAQGILQGISGIGAICGSLVVASSTETNRGRKLVYVAILLGTALIAFSISTNYYVTMPIMLFIGAATASRMSIGQVLVQTYADDEYRGRVISVWQMQISIVSLGTFAVGVLAEFMGPRLAIGGLAAGMVIAMLLILAFVPRMREMQ